MKGYIVKYENDLVCVTNNFEKWLAENNKQRVKDGFDVETEFTFTITEVEINMYK